MQVNAADVDLIVRQERWRRNSNCSLSNARVVGDLQVAELEISREDADHALRIAKGDLAQALSNLTN